MSRKRNSLYFLIGKGVVLINSYNGILNIIKQQNKDSSSSAVVIGKVLSTNPLSISIGELFLDREDLMVNESIKSFKEGDLLAMVPTTNK